MGGRNSKSVSSAQRKNIGMTTLTSDKNISVNSPTKFDERTVYILGRELAENPNIFVLNNILLSVMFFENYRKELQKFVYSNSTKMEKELNPKLLREETIKCITPDVMFEEVNKNIRFRPLHGPGKIKSNPLVARRIYVVNDSVEVLDSMDQPHYTAIDKPNCQVHLENSNRKGYVKLKQIDQINVSTLQTDHKNTEPQPGPSSQDEEYEYTTITDVKTPKPLNIVNYERRNTLPKTCFVIKKVKKYEEQSDNSDSDEYMEKPNKVIEEDLYESISYVSSRGFMTYFQNAVFPNSLGRALGFNEMEINLAKAIPGTIFCNMIDEDDNTFPCEVIPSISIQWPAEHAFEFEMREERPTITDQTSGMRYRWPTDEMIRDVKELSCVLIPKGYFQKKGMNADTEIEWEISFPKAERYIEARMSHAQMRCFLCLLALYKTFIEPVTLKHGLLVEHIRTHMYWECEANFKDWPEHRLGTKLIKVISNFIAHLSKKHLSDYFIKEKNVFENIPRKYLLSAQRIFHNVLESPTIYLIGALRNLRYTNRKFYPTLDFNELYTILVTEGIKTVNSNLLPEISQPPNYRKIKRRFQQDTDRNTEKELDWRYKKEKLIRARVLEKRKQEKEMQEYIQKEEFVRRDSVDSIDYGWKCEKQFDVFKNRQILTFFINHFIEIAKKCRRLSTNNQALFYLKQSYYLCKLLDGFGLAMDARDYFEVIAREENICKRLSATEVAEQVAPPTPTRNSIQFNFELTQQVKTNNINLNNLNKSYMDALTTNIPNLKRNPSNLKGTRVDIIRQSALTDEPRKSVNFS